MAKWDAVVNLRMALQDAIAHCAICDGRGVRYIAGGVMRCSQCAWWRRVIDDTKGTSEPWWRRWRQR